MAFNCFENFESKSAFNNVFFGFFILCQPVQHPYMEESVVAVAPTATCAVCATFDALRTEVQLRTSVQAGPHN